LWQLAVPTVAELNSLKSRLIVKTLAGFDNAFAARLSSQHFAASEILFLLFNLVMPNQFCSPSSLAVFAGAFDFAETDFRMFCVRDRRTWGLGRFKQFVLKKRRSHFCKRRSCKCSRRRASLKSRGIESRAGNIFEPAWEKSAAGRAPSP
jgi:hypothetical protein